MQDIISDNSPDNKKKFYSYIKSKGQEMVGVAPLKNIAGFIQSDSKSMPVYWTSRELTCHGTKQPPQRAINYSQGNRSTEATSKSKLP